MLSSCRIHDMLRPRFAAMYLSREVTGTSMPFIGRLFLRDHTTVLHGIRRARDAMDRDPSFAADVAAIRARLGIGDGA
jgi:chromosomal replication initiator protein